MMTCRYFYFVTSYSTMFPVTKTKVKVANFLKQVVGIQVLPTSSAGVLLLGEEFACGSGEILGLELWAARMFFCNLQRLGETPAE